MKMAHRNRQNSRTRAFEVVAVKSDPSSQNTKSAEFHHNQSQLFFNVFRKKENNSGILKSASNEISLLIPNKESKDSTNVENEAFLEEQAAESEDSIGQLLNLDEV